MACNAQNIHRTGHPASLRADRILDRFAPGPSCKSVFQFAYPERAKGVDSQTPRPFRRSGRVAGDRSNILPGRKARKVWRGKTRWTTRHEATGKTYGAIRLRPARKMATRQTKDTEYFSYVV